METDPLAYAYEKKEGMLKTMDRYGLKNEMRERLVMRISQNIREKIQDELAYRNASKTENNF